MPKRFLSSTLLLLLAFAATATAQKPAPAQPQNATIAPILPQSFAGWTKIDSKMGHDATAFEQGIPSIAIPDVGGEKVSDSNKQRVASLLQQEDGLVDVELATYRKSGTLDQHRKASQEQIFAMRFRDASGAFAAFTLYRPYMYRATVTGDSGVGTDHQALFVRGNIFVIAPFSVTEPPLPLKELDAALPRATGSAALLPTLPQYIPAKTIEENSLHYVLGPQSWTAAERDRSIEGNLPPASLINFDFSPEIVTAALDDKHGSGALMIISYPTPQMAIKQAQLIEQYGKQNAHGITFELKREGPLVAVIVGSTQPENAITPQQAQAILAQINYTAQITGNEATKLAKSDNIGILVLQACILAGLIALCSIIPGVLIGLRGEILDRLMPSRAARRAEENEMITLGLKPPDKQG